MKRSGDSALCRQLFTDTESPFAGTTSVEAQPMLLRPFGLGVKSPNPTLYREK